MWHDQGNESLIEHIEFFTSYSTSLKMLHFDPNSINIGHLVTELNYHCQVHNNFPANRGTGTIMHRDHTNELYTMFILGWY